MSKKKTITEDYPLLMPEEIWANSQLSIARHYGRINMNGREYIICDKTGRDIFQLSAIAEKQGKQKAIEPGEPADLVLKGPPKGNHGASQKCRFGDCGRR